MSRKKKQKQAAKDYLRQLWWIDREINLKYRQLEELKARAESCASPKLTGMPKGNGQKETLSDLVIKIADLENYINKRTDGLIDLKAQIIKQIDAMKSQTDREILTRRYVLHEKWEDMAGELSYDVSYLLRLHKQALRNFESAYPEIKDQR